MAKWSPSSMSNAFAEAEAYLSKGKSKTDRPLSSTTRLRLVNDDTIAVVLHSTAVVTYHRDSTFTIYGGGWNTVTTKKAIREFSPVNIWSHEGAWVVGYTGESTPARVQKCRTCHGTGKNDYGVTAWSDGNCYRCQGVGRVDYGSMPIPVTKTASEPYKVNSSGEYLGDAEYPSIGYGNSSPTSTYYSSSYQDYAPPVAKYSMGGEVADELAKVMPGINEFVVNPAHDNEGSRQKVRDIIVSLNDQYHWTREEIADWLETLDVNLKF